MGESKPPPHQPGLWEAECCKLPPAGFRAEPCHLNKLLRPFMALEMVFLRSVIGLG